MQQNNDIDNLDLNAEETESYSQLSEAPKIDSKTKQKIRSRVSFLKSRLRLPVSVATGASAIIDYVSAAQNNPKKSHYKLLQSLSSQKRDAISSINSAVPIPMILNASDNQLRRNVRDVLKEEPVQLQEAFNPPAMLLLKRQAIRHFPNNQRVALYTDNKYGLTFTVPYDSLGRGFTSMGGIPASTIGVMAESVEEASTLVLTSGDEVVVTDDMLNMLEDVYNSLTEENQIRMADMLLEDMESFNRVVEFAKTLNEDKMSAAKKALDSMATALAKRNAASQALKQKLPAGITKNPEWQRSIAKDAENKVEDLKMVGRAAATTATAAAATNEIKKRMKNK